MKHLVRLNFLLLCLLLVGVGTASAQTADQVRLKMIEAQGGAAVLEKIKDMTIVSDFSMPAMNITGTATNYQKEPNKSRSDMEFMGMKMSQGYDGQTPWAIDPQSGKPVEMNPTQAREMKHGASGTSALLNPAKFGYTYTLKPKESVDGKEYIVIEISHDDGFKSTQYIDPTTFLTYKTSSLTLNQAGVEVPSETILGDYRKEGTMMIPHKITVKQGGQVFVEVTVREVSFNSGLEDTLFTIAK